MKPQTELDDIHHIYIDMSKNPQYLGTSTCRNIYRYSLPYTFYWTFVTGYSIFDSFYIMLTTYTMLQILIAGNCKELQGYSERLTVTGQQ